MTVAAKVSGQWLQYDPANGIGEPDADCLACGCPLVPGKWALIQPEGLVHQLCFLFGRVKP